MKLSATLFSMLLCIYAHSQAPIAAQHPKVLSMHGSKRVDPYYWLRHWQNPDVTKYLQQENAYLNTVLAPTAALQQKISQEILQRTKLNDEQGSYEANGYKYYTYPGTAYPVYTRINIADTSIKQVLFYGDSFAIGHRYFAISNFGIQVSPDNKLLALSIDTSGTGVYVTLFKDIAGGKWLNESLTNTIGDAIFANDNRTLIYTCYNKAGRAAIVKAYTLGEAKDKVLYQEHNKAFDVYVHRTASGKYIMLYAFGGNSTECSILNAEDVSGKFKVLQKREEGLTYTAEHVGNKWYMLTNYQAPNCRLMQAHEDATAKENWQEVMHENAKGKVFSMRAYSNYIALLTLVNGTEQIQVLNLTDGKTNTVSLPSQIHSLHFNIAPCAIDYNYNSDELQFSYSTLTTPTATYNYNMKTGALLKLRELYIDSYNSDQYEAQRLWATNENGVAIPISIVYKKGTPIDGTAPLLLSGYGAYGGYDSPRFSASILSLLDRGFVYAIAHTRGGEELGHTWYEQGKHLNKLNTFADFVTCAQHLIKQGYANPKLLFAEGQSAGGLIMGYMANNYPKLFKGLIFDVPFLDVVTTMQGDSYDYTEWGNPNIKAEYDYMLSYSPYDNVKQQTYPAMLVMVGFYDQYWDGAKWIAKARDNNTANTPQLLFTDFNAAHDGPSGKAEIAKQLALKYAFILQQCGIAE